MWPLLKSSEESSMGETTVMDGWGWQQVGLGARQDIPSTKLALCHATSHQQDPVSPHLPRQGLRCLGGMGQGRVALLHLL